MSTGLKQDGYLRWKCRRGMLELDVVFERFLNSGMYDQLTPKQKALFDVLLEQPDPLIFNWLMGRETLESCDFDDARDLHDVLTKALNGHIAL